MMKGRKQPASVNRSTSTNAPAAPITAAAAEDPMVLSAVMESTGAMMAYLDPDFNFLAVNSAYAKGSGHPAKELLGKNHFALFPNQENQAIFTKVRDTGEPVAFLDKPFEFADQPERGTTYWDWTLGPVKDKDGRVRGLIFSLLETTKRKMAEEAAIDAARFPEENPHPVLRLSKDGTVMYCNPAGMPILVEWKCKIGELAPSEWRRLASDVFASKTRREFEQKHGAQTFSFILAPIVQAGYVNAYGRDVTARKEAEEALRESERRLNDAQRIAHIGSWEWDIENDKMIWSDEMLRMHGIDSESSVPKIGTLLSSIHPDDRQSVANLARRVMTDGGSGGVDYRIVLPDGSTRMLHSQGQVIAFDENGRPSRMVGTAQDITEQKEAENKLAKQALMLSSANDAIIGYDLEYNITFWNQAAERLYGHAASEVMGKKSHEVFHPLYEGISREELISRLNETGHVEAESVRKTRDGRSLDVESHVILLRDVKGNPSSYVAIDRDITERKRAEKALREAHEELEARVQERTRELRDASQKLKMEIAERQRADEAVKAERARLTDILEDLPAYLILLTPDYHVSYANRFFRERFGESHGKRCYEYLFHRTDPCEICETYKTLKVGSRLEWEWKGPDGRLYHIHDSPFKDVDGTTLIMEVGIDITERKRAEEALRQAHDSLELRVDERTKELRQSAEKLQAEMAERMKGEEALRRSEERYRSLFANMIDGYAYHKIILDETGRPVDYIFLEANEAFERLTGLKRADIINRRATEVLPGIQNDPAGWLGRYGKVAMTGESIRFENYAESLDRWYSVAAYSPERGFFATAFEDITERKRSEEALKRSQTDLNHAQAVANVGSWRLNIKHNELRWSDETHRIFGIKLGTTLTYEAFLSAVHPEDRELVDKNWQAALRGEPYDIEHRIVVSGEVKWVREQAELEVDGEGALVGGFGTVQDITERKRMEQELRSSLEAARRRESEISALLNASRAILKSQQFQPAARSIFNSCKEIIGASAGYVALLSKDESMNDVVLLDAGEQPCTVDPSLPMPIRGLRAEAYETGKVVFDNDFSNSEWMRFIPGGHVELRNVLFAPLIIGAKTVGIIGLANKPGGFNDHDATMALTFGELASIALINSRNMEELEDRQRRLSEYSQRLEQMVEERTKELQDAQRLAAIGETAGMVGHDIRNPLQSIEGALYLARESIHSLPANGRETKELSEVLEIIQNQATYINHVVADLQDFARTPTPQLKEIDIRELMEEALSSVGIPQPIEVEKDFEAQLNRPKVDPVHMKRVLVNLIENAVQAMPRGGTLTLKVHSDERFARISVGDTGVGIPEADKPRIFMPLFTTKAKGQGFGLAVCRKLVRAHRGEITFESEAGKGSTFIITLPITNKAD